MSRLILAFSLVVLTSCSGDRCRLYGSYAPDGSLSAAPFVYPNAGFLQTDADSPTGYRSKVPLGYRAGVLFAGAFERLDGLGTTGPLLVSDDFVNTYFTGGVSLDLLRADSLAPVTLGALAKPPRGLRGALPETALEAQTEYWLTVSGKPSLLPCNDGPIIALTESDAQAERMERRLAPAVRKDRRTVAIPFRTQSIERTLHAAAARAASSDVPRVIGASAHAPRDANGDLNKKLFDTFPALIRGIRYGEEPLMPLDNIGHIFVGTLETLEFRRDKLLTESPRGTRRVRFLLTLPHLGNTARLPMPGTPAQPRLVIFSHPLRACKEAALGLADTLAGHGFAVAAIDHVEHGDRQTNPPSNYVCGESIPWAFFANGDPEVLRDNVRASALDLYQFKLALQRAGPEAFDANGDGLRDYLADRPAVVGMSLGSIIAVPFLAISGDVEAAVLNTALGSTIELLDQHNPDTSRYNLPFPGPMPSLNMAMTQAILDAGEPVNFAATLRAHPRDLLVQQAIDDAVVPNTSTEKLARALGLRLVEPVVRSVSGLERMPAPYTGAPTRALVQIPDVNHSFLLIPRDESVLEPARRQVAYFLWSHYVLQGASVIPIERP